MNTPWDELEALFPRAVDGILPTMRDVGVLQGVDFV